MYDATACDGNPNILEIEFPASAPLVGNVGLGASMTIGFKVVKNTTAAGSINNGCGGVSPNATLLPLSCGLSVDGCSLFISAVAGGNVVLMWCVEGGLRVTVTVGINNSHLNRLGISTLMLTALGGVTSAIERR